MVHMSSPMKKLYFTNGQLHITERSALALQSGGSQLVKKSLATGLIFQECQTSCFSNNDSTKSLSLALQRSNNPLHGQVSIFINLVRAMPT